MSGQMVKSKDKPRSGCRLSFFTNCVRSVIEKALSICVLIQQDRKVKAFNVTISKFRAQRSGDI